MGRNNMTDEADRADDTGTEPTVMPGEGCDLTVTFTNHTPSTLETVSVMLDAPDEWESEPTTATFHNIAAGSAIEGGSESENDAATSWMVRPPMNVEPGEYALTATAEYADSASKTTFELTVESN